MALPPDDRDPRPVSGTLSPDLDLPPAQLYTPDAAVSTDSAGTATAGDAPPLDESSAAGRYRPVRAHARGGLGEVLLAEDGELNRPVALKRIQERRADDPDSRRRFLREAEITARLQHPGIVPVYGLTADAHGRPCYAMRFIEGESLQDALQRFHRTGDDGQSRQRLAADQVEFRELLGRFVAVCNAVAYAHSRGVVHRDLKPANVMLGKFAETLVVDWGLARPFARTEAERASGEETLMPTPDAGLEGTVIGSAVGTPAFMSPEQAEGRIDEVGPASDVFSLGATLYSLLTGRPPYQGRHAVAVLEQAKRCDFRPPRAVRPGVPAALEAICLKAMARQPEDRYATAKDLAEDIERWLADQPVTARREPWGERARRWVRGHRTLVSSLVVALVLACAGLVANSIQTRWYIDHLIDAQAKEKDAREQADAARKQAERDATAAAEQRRLTLETLKSVIDDVGVAGQSGLHTVRGRLLQKARDGLEQVTRSLDASAATAETDRLKFMTLLLLGDINFYKVAGGDRGGIKAARDYYDRARALAERLARGEPDSAEWRSQLGDCFNKIGTSEWLLGNTEGAEAAFRRYHQIMSRLAADFPAEPGYKTGLALSHIQLGSIPYARGSVREATDEYRRAERVARQLVEADPKSLQWPAFLEDMRNKLNQMALLQGRVEEALQGFQQQIAVYQRMADAGNTAFNLQRVLADAHSQAGAALLLLGRLDAADEQLKAAGNLLLFLERLEPEDFFLKANLANVSRHLGELSWLRGDARQAITSAERSIQRYQWLAERDDQNVVPWSGLAAADIVLMNAGLQQGDAARAATAAKKLNEHVQRLAKAAAGNVHAQVDLANSYFALGLTAQFQGNLKEAEAAYRKGRENLARLESEGRILGNAYAQAVRLSLESKAASLSGGHQAAAATAERLAVCEGAGWYAPFYAACGYSMALQALRGDRPPEELPAADKQLAEHYTFRALELLRRSTTLGLRNVEFIKRVPDLAALRSLDGFKKLIAELEPAPKKP